MKKVLNYILPIGIIILAGFLRVNNLSYRAPFDWDQNRDYQEVAKIASGKLTLIGPVAKGEGGFFLGPLYYYLLLPAYSLLDGSPVALPLTSVIIDILALIGFIYVGYSLGLVGLGLGLASFYGFANVAIESSRTSWNVALVPLWFSILLFLLTRPKYTYFTNLWLGLVLGLSWHIHAALIPLSPLLLLLRPGAYGLTSKRILATIFGYFLAYSPLILFDLRHAGLQTNLIFQFFNTQSGLRAPLPQMLFSVLGRLGKNLSTLITGVSDLNITLGLIGIALSTFAIFQKTFIVRLLGTITILNFFFVLGLGQLAFPEYYLQLATLSLIMILIYYLTRHRFSYLLFILFALYQFSFFTTTPTSFSLSQKLALSNAISQLPQPIELRSDLPFGRDSGLEFMIKQSGASLTPNAKTQVLISEKNDTSLLIDGELAKELGWFGGFRVAYLELE